MSRELKQRRIIRVNSLIRIIGDSGRHFFRHKDQYARMELDDNGRLWWVDDYTQKKIYLHYPNWRKGFSHGGTMRDLVNRMKEFVMHGHSITGVGPWPQWICDGDLWGYGESMEIVRAAVCLINKEEQSK